MKQMRRCRQRIILTEGGIGGDAVRVREVREGWGGAEGEQVPSSSFSVLANSSSCLGGGGGERRRRVVGEKGEWGSG